MKRITLYESAKQQIDQLKIVDLPDYECGKLLYADIWHMYDFSLMQKLKRTAALIVCNPMHLSCYPDSVESENIAIEIHFTDHVQRADNAAIYNNLYEYLKPARHVLIEKKYKADLKGILKRIRRLFKYASCIEGFKVSERLYLAAQLVMVKGLTERLDEIQLFKGSRYLLIFQEYDTVSSSIIQNARLHGVKAISPQHGMPMNRHENADQMFFDGFQCDYKLLWNEFTKKQYMSAGISEDRLFVVGNTKEMKKVEDNCGLQKPASVSSDGGTENAGNEDEAERFGVLLDYPKNDGAYENNCSLLKAAEELAEAAGMKYLIKPHPTDLPERYSGKYSPEISEMLDAGVSMEEYKEKVRFSLAHITGAIFDLIYDGRFVFQYITEERFPVDLDGIYRFSSPQELIEKHAAWQSEFVRYGEEFKKTVEKYRICDAKERHDMFFENLFSGKLDS